ncbi:MAG: Lar family restriction alleviation protein [Magnetococcales bacterium]|nr:Lar family restriction alleviation protein [Magnetococcales bacterium]
MKLRPCPFCGGKAEFEQLGTRFQSCTVACTECGGRHESGDSVDRNGSSWNMMDKSNDRLVAASQGLLSSLRDILSIVEASDGVSGWHKNDDIAYWDDFEAIQEARAAIANYRQATVEVGKSCAGDDAQR